MNQDLTVKSDSFEYKVHIHRDERGLGALVGNLPKASKSFVFCDEIVFELFNKFISFEFEKHSIDFEWIILKRGEKNKHISRLEKVYNSLIEKGADRKSILIALGGGVVGDFTGFVASTFLRGIRFVQVPTTLLAMVDSSVGGKVAVNVGRGKNMVGSFYQPEFVYIPLNVLDTLPKREWKCGLAEIVKHGLLAGGDYFELVQSLGKSDLRSDSTRLMEVVKGSIGFKASIVSQDEKENGLRAILNFGHTTGHAIESLTKYKRYSHGEAVAKGIVTALIVSKQKFDFSDLEWVTVLKIYKALGLSPVIFEKNTEILSHMSHDKKKDGKDLRFVLLKKIGEPVFGITVTESEILQSLKLQKSMDWQ